MGVVSTKLDKKGLSKLFISLNESCDGLMHEYSLILSESTKNALEHDEYREHNTTSERYVSLTHKCYTQQQGLVNKIWFYKDTRGATDLLKNFNEYTEAILSLGDCVLSECDQVNFKRVQDQYATVLHLQREGRDYFKILVKAEKKERAEAKQRKVSIIPLKHSKSA